jgi:hypothetical protein
MKPEKFAKLCMLGTRRGSDREAWRHPEDLVKEIAKIPENIISSTMRRDMTEIAWLHDVIEDGILEGKPVTYKTLIENDFHSCARDVHYLSRVNGQARWTYYAKLEDQGSHAAKIVKVLDRCVNLREGAETFNRDWFMNYRRDARLDVLPLLTRTRRYPQYEKLVKWVTLRLEKAMEVPEKWQHR